MEVVDRWFAAFNAHDLTALSELFDPDGTVVPAVATISPAPGAMFRGRDGLLSFLKPVFARWPGLRLDALRSTHVGDKIVVWIRFRLDDGSTRDGVTIFTVQDGR